MTRIIVDATVRSKLNNLAEPLEFCTEDGVVLGQFIPKVDLSQLEPWVPEFDEAELDRQEANGQWYTTAEVLAHLKNLGQK